jgi:hypothetical protein
MQGGMDRAILHAHFATDLVAMQQDAFDAGVSQHLDSRITGDPLGPLAPKNDFSLHIQHADADLQVVENFSVDLGILESWHTAAQSDCCLYIGEAGAELKRSNWSKRGSRVGWNYRCGANLFVKRIGASA